MPTYSYRCTECGNAFDIQQSFSDATLTDCPSCGGKLRKIFSPVGVTFNGSGFYRTDSRAKSDSGSSGGGSSSTGSSSGAGTTPKSDSKPSAPAAPAASTSSKPAAS